MVGVPSSAVRPTAVLLVWTEFRKFSVSERTVHRTLFIPAKFRFSHTCTHTCTHSALQLPFNLVQGQSGQCNTGCYQQEEMQTVKCWREPVTCLLDGHQRNQTSFCLIQNWRKLWDQTSAELRPHERLLGEGLWSLLCSSVSKFCSCLENPTFVISILLFLCKKHLVHFFWTS